METSLRLKTGNYDRDVIFCCNPNELQCLWHQGSGKAKKDPFLKEILKYWAETNLLNQVSCEIVIQEQVLWFNSLLKKVNEPIFASCSVGLWFWRNSQRAWNVLRSEAERRVPARQHSTSLNWFANDSINFDGIKYFISILQRTLIKAIWTSSTVKRWARLR